MCIRDRFRIEPFLLCWGLLLTPTFLVWTAFVMAVFVVSRSRYATYALGLGAMALTGFFQARGKMNWSFNWDLWGIVRWSDNIRQLEDLAEAGILDPDESASLAEIYRRLRDRGHRLVLEGRKTLVDAAEFAEERAFVREIWQRRMAV